MIKYLSIDEAILIAENRIRGSMFETLGAKQFLERFINKGQLIPIFYFNGYGILNLDVSLDDMEMKNIWHIDGYFLDKHAYSLDNLKAFGRSNSITESAFKNLSNSIFKLKYNSGILHEVLESRFVGTDEAAKLINKTNVDIEAFLKRRHAILFNDEPIYEGRYDYEDMDDTIVIDRGNVFFAIEDINNILEQLPVNTGQNIAAPAMTAAPYQNNNHDDQRIAELTKQLEQAHADNDLLRKKLDDHKELQPSSTAAVTRLLNVLFYKLDYDVSAHSGTLNKQLIEYSKHPSVNAKISKGFLVPWLKRVQQLRIEAETGSHDRHAPL
uniref:hypothetical protein n=1 Tax=Psychrobacter sp. TaxID=56811 RepID=UPI001597D851|nr:hypothetical protein [Psychrobacter sp.]QJS05571.1 hypothetical protein [Psychrobacter sp.]